jgi:hypothetical protein
MVCFALAIVLLHATTGHAGDHVYSAHDPVWKEECGSCHLAYPPQLLSARGWRALMNGLDRHFGGNASVDARTAAHVTAFLERNAGDERRFGASTRITGTRWFARKHDELAPSAWRHSEVRTPANCAACHRNADAGDFGKRSRQVPR